MLPKAAALEAACALALKGEYLPADGGIDLRRRDNGLGLEIKLGLRSLRDLRSAAFELGYTLAAGKGGLPRRLALVIPRPPISTKRLDAEWASFSGLLRPSIAGKLHLVVVDPDRSSVFPPHPALQELARKLEPVFGAQAPEAPRAFPRLPSEKFFDVFTVLLSRWLRDRRPVSVQQLEGSSGASYTSVSQALHRLEEAGEIDRRRNGDVDLKGFPWSTWREVTAVLGSLRGTCCYRDGSGRGLRPAALLQILKREAPANAGIGGTLAAARRDPGFDLQGLPRLDLTVHGAQEGGCDRTARSLHASLRPCKPGATDVVLALHPLRRRASLFSPDSRKGIRWADDVEMLLDLHELRLMEQAEAMIQTLLDRPPVGAHERD